MRFTANSNIKPFSTSTTRKKAKNFYGFPNKSVDILKLKSLSAPNVGFKQYGLESSKFNPEQFNMVHCIPAFAQRHLILMI